MYGFLYYRIARFLPGMSTPCKLLFRLIGKSVRGMCAKHLLKKCGKNVNIERNTLFDSKCSIGDNSSIGENCRLIGEVIIGDDVMMAPRCVFYTVGHCYNRLDIPMRLQGNSEMQSIQIGNDVWIGYGCIFLPGVKVGDGAVIGAGSVVRYDVPPFSVVLGNPARIVKMRKE